MAKPEVVCSSGNKSPKKALNGSMVTLMEASIIQNRPTAIHSDGEFGVAKSAKLPRIAPIAKNGLRLPHLTPYVLSE